MAKFDYSKLTSHQQHALLHELVKVVRTLKTEKDTYQFLQRLLTPSELVMIGRRLQIADGLIRGKTYASIRKELGVGFSTIRSVDSWLEHAVRNYHDVRAQQRKAKTVRKRGREPDIIGTFGDVHHRYAGAFLFLDLLLGDYKSKK